MANHLTNRETSIPDLSTLPMELTDELYRSLPPLLSLDSSDTSTVTSPRFLRSRAESLPRVAFPAAAFPVTSGRRRGGMHHYPDRHGWSSLVHRGRQPHRLAPAHRTSYSLQDSCLVREQPSCSSNILLCSARLDICSTDSARPPGAHWSRLITAHRNDIATIQNT